MKEGRKLGITITIINNNESHAKKVNYDDNDTHRRTSVFPFLDIFALLGLESLYY